MGMRKSMEPALVERGVTKRGARTTKEGPGPRRPICPAKLLAFSAEELAWRAQGLALAAPVTDSRVKSFLL